MILIYDQIWDEVPAPASLIELKTAARRALPVGASSTLEEAEQLSRQLLEDLDPAESIVAYGGGSVLDKTKLAVWNLHAKIRPYISRGRAGIVTIPVENSLDVTLIPTTLGTGSEANSNAIVQVGSHRRRLVMQRGAGSFAHCHVPDAYAGLTLKQVKHATLEILLRAVGIASVVEEADAAVFLNFAREAAEYARRVCVMDLPQEDEQLMGRIAELSALTHQVPLTSKNTLWVWPLWYVANELSSLADVSKLDATVALARAVIPRTEELGYGSNSVIREIEESLEEPLEEFVTRVGGPLEEDVLERIAGVSAEALADQVRSQWAGGILPILASREFLIEALEVPEHARN
ncbi:MAG: iron-containing alcohol dehydrogenase [Actinomycetaceae bacterium]|nr:iron-containing alcohol dehydrogenase [Actinomycetaceae bacterium]